MPQSSVNAPAFRGSSGGRRDPARTSRVFWISKPSAFCSEKSSPRRSLLLNTRFFSLRRGNLVSRDVSVGSRDVGNAT